MKNQRGMVSLDYLFAFVLVGGFSFLIMALSFSLSVVEIVQYMTFTSARSYYAGNVNPDAQLAAGDMKFKTLMTHPVLAPLFSNGWFSLELNTLAIGDISTKADPKLAQYKGQNDENNLFFGTVINLNLNVLDFNVPFFGSTSDGGGQTGKKTFSSYIGSYLGRETTFEECENFMIDRFKAIRQLQSGSPAQPYSSVNAVDTYVPSDNGC